MSSINFDAFRARNMEDFAHLPIGLTEEAELEANAEARINPAPLNPSKPTLNNLPKEIGHRIDSFLQTKDAIGTLPRVSKGVAEIFSSQVTCQPDDIEANKEKTYFDVPKVMNDHCFNKIVERYPNIEILDLSKARNLTGGANTGFRKLTRRNLKRVIHREDTPNEKYADYLEDNKEALIKKATTPVTTSLSMLVDAVDFSPIGTGGAIAGAKLALSLKKQDLSVLKKSIILFGTLGVYFKASELLGLEMDLPLTALSSLIGLNSCGTYNPDHMQQVMPISQDYFISAVAAGAVLGKTIGGEVATVAGLGGLLLGSEILKRHDHNHNSFQQILLLSAAIGSFVGSGTIAGLFTEAGPMHGAIGGLIAVIATSLAFTCLAANPLYLQDILISKGKIALLGLLGIWLVTREGTLTDMGVSGLKTGLGLVASVGAEKLGQKLYHKTLSTAERGTNKLIDYLRN